MSRSVPSPTTPELSPPARRPQRPTWLDLRLLVGVLLVLAAVITGARVVSAADDSVTVWAMTADLAAGTTLTESDIETIDVGLGEHAAAYVAAGSNPAGLTLTRDVNAGDLLPASALDEGSDLVGLALSVPASNIPMSVARGDRVSIYATGADGAAGAADTATTGATVLVVDAAAVADVSERSQGALSVGSGDLQIVVRIPECAVAAILDDTADRVLTVIEVPSAARPAQDC